MELTDFQAHDLQTALMMLPQLKVDMEDFSFSWFVS